MMNGPHAFKEVDPPTILLKQTDVDLILQEKILHLHLTLRVVNDLNFVVIQSADVSPWVAGIMLRMGF